MKLVGFSSLFSNIFSKELLQSRPDEISIVEEDHQNEVSNRRKSILVIKNPGDLAAVDSCLDGGFKHVVHLSHPFLLQEIEVAAAMISDFAGFMQHPAAVILLGKPDEQKIFVKKITTLAEKIKTLEELHEFITKRFRTSVWDSVLNIADELLTNLIFHAPESALEIPRKKLKETAAASFFCGYHNNRLVVGTSDLFGTFNPLKFLQRISSVQANGMANSVMPSSNPGAGIGGYIMLKNSAGIYVGVEEGKHTTIAFTIPTDFNIQSKDSVPQNVHVEVLTPAITKNATMSSFGSEQVQEKDCRRFSLRGHIDEEFEFTKFPVGDAQQVIIDLDGVCGINSLGIREWLQWMASMKNAKRVVLKNCPKMIVDQMNMVMGFLPANAVVESFYVPYFSEKTGEEKSVLFINGREFAGPHVTAPDNIVDKNGDKMEMDVLPAKYFKFLQR